VGAVGDPVARWPKLQEYHAAIIKAEADFEDELRGLRVQRHPTFSWDAWGRAGNFGVVFKIESDAVAYALKIFYKPQHDRKLRYRFIDQHLRNIPMPRRLVSFAYDETGIRINDRDHPTLRMDWANGDPLDTYLARRFSASEPVDNGMLFEEWIATLQELEVSALAHGDLQHKNILVQADGTFCLVDYDGMFVPGMRQHGLTACEAGVSAYQHPNRKDKKSPFDERIDDFSALVILLTLACVDADLWQRYHEEDRLLLSEVDLLCPSESALLTELAGRKGAVGMLAELVRTAAEQSLDQVPSFGRVISELGMEWSGRGVGARSSADQPRVLSREWSTAPWQQPGATRFPADAAASPQPLTYAERQVAGLLAAGKTVDEIVSALGLHRATVEKYAGALERKIGPEDAASPMMATGRSARPPAQVAEPPPAEVAAPPTAQQRAFSPRQQQVLDLLHAGLMPAQIAARLHVQLATVNRHLSSIRTVIGDDEVRKLLSQAAAKPAPAKAAAAKAAMPTRAGKAPTTSSRTTSSRPPGRPPSVPGPASRRPTPPPVRPSRGSHVGATITALLAILAIFIAIVTAIH
jgi:DNA-binding NarL/FixJ family response regulator